MKLSDLIIAEGPYGTPYTDETFKQSFHNILWAIAFPNNNLLGSDRGALLCAPAGIYIDLRPAGLKGVKIMVYGFNPSHPATQPSGRWEVQNYFRNMDAAKTWIDNKIQTAYPQNEEIQTEKVSKRSLLNRLYKAIEPLTKGIFHDESWQPVNAVKTKFNSLGLNWNIMNSHYESGVFPPTYKIWEFEIRFINQNGRGDKIFGRITASGAGSVKEPLEKYDVTVTMS